MNENKAIALEIMKLQGATISAKETSEKYNEVLKILDNYSGSKACTGVAVGGVSGETRKPTRIEVIMNALKNAGYVIVDYKSNYDHQKNLTGLVIAPLKD